MLYPRNRDPKATSRIATVTAGSGQTVSGKVIYGDEFTLTLVDADGWQHSFSLAAVKVEVDDPMRGHMRNLEAYMARLLEETVRGRTVLADELRGEFKLLARTLASVPAGRAAVGLAGCRTAPGFSPRSDRSLCCRICSTIWAYHVGSRASS